MLTGIDISHWQQELDLDAATIKADFVFCKATEGMYWKDPTARQYTREARSHGVWVGFYHYFHPKMDLALQAQNFYDYVMELGLPERHPLFGDGLAIDVETNNGLQRETVDRQLRKFISLVQEKFPGRRITIYTRKSFFDPYVSTDTWYSQFLL